MQLDYAEFTQTLMNTERTLSLYYDSGDIVAQRLALVRQGELLHIYAWTKHSSRTIYVAFWDLGQILKIRDCPRDSGTVGAYVNLMCHTYCRKIQVTSSCTVIGISSTDLELQLCTLFHGMIVWLYWRGKCKAHEVDEQLKLLEVYLDYR